MITDQRLRIRAIAFDLDGTLLDTIHDLAAAINMMLDRLGLAPLPKETIRVMVGKGIANLVRGREDRLWPVAIAPAGHPPAMADELRRCVNELGFKAGHLAVYTRDRNLNDPAFFPYYEAAQELNVPLFAHPNSLGALTDRFDSFFAQHGK